MKTFLGVVEIENWNQSLSLEGSYEGERSVETCEIRKIWIYYIYKLTNKLSICQEIVGWKFKKFIICVFVGM